jgi:hypothetical protein
VIEDLVRGVGWVILKTLSLGRYASAGSGAELFEGTVGLLSLAGITWAAYRWFT